MNLNSLTRRFYLLIFMKNILLYLSGSHSIVIAALYMRGPEMQTDKMIYSSGKNEKK